MIYCWYDDQIPQGLRGVRALLWHRHGADPYATGRLLSRGDGEDALFLRHVERHTPWIASKSNSGLLVEGADLAGVYDYWIGEFLGMLRGVCRGVKHLVVEYEGRLGIGYWSLSANGNIPRALQFLRNAQEYAKDRGVDFPLAGFDAEKLNTKAHTFPLAYAWEQLVHDHSMAYLREIARAYEFVFDAPCPISNYQAADFAIEDLNGHPMPVGRPGTISAPRGYLDSTKLSRQLQAERLGAQMLTRSVQSHAPARMLWWCSGTFRGDRHPIETQYQWPEEADWTLAQSIARHCEDVILWTGAFQTKYEADRDRLMAMEHAATALYAAAYAQVQGVSK